MCNTLSPYKIWKSWITCFPSSHIFFSLHFFTQLVTKEWSTKTQPTLLPWLLFSLPPSLSPSSLLHPYTPPTYVYESTYLPLHTPTNLHTYLPTYIPSNCCPCSPPSLGSEYCSDLLSFCLPPLLLKVFSTGKAHMQLDTECCVSVIHAIKYTPGLGQPHLL